MPAPRRPEYDTQEFKDLWHSKTHIEEIGRIYGVSGHSIHLAAMRRGFPCKWTVRNGEGDG